MHARGAALALLTMVGLCGIAPRGEANTFTTTIQPTPSATSDAFMREDQAGTNFGTDNSLRLRARTDAQIRQPVIDIPLTGLAGKSVLQAYLRLSQVGGSNAQPIVAPVYALTEDWVESQVTWDTRRIDLLLLGVPWTQPGGTHGPYWSDRALVSSATTGSTVSWQVGPIVEAWLNGDLAQNGFVLPADHVGPDREVVFNSSDVSTASQRPSLVVTYTDEAPSLRSGWAEVQPTAVRTGAVDTPITLWLDVDAQGTTPSGAATGFDALAVSHAGTLAVTGVKAMTVGGVPIPTALVSFADNGSSVTFHFPRVRAKTRVMLTFSANVLSGVLANGVDLRMSVDDTATPGAAAQALWPGDADGIGKNGDSWVLNIINSTPVSIDLAPDTAQLSERTCTTFTLYGTDAAGFRFPLTASSMSVVPPSAGTVSIDGQFCAAAAGNARVVATYGSLSDSSVVYVLPANLPVVSEFTLRDRRGVVTTTLVPADTMFLELHLADGDGFKDVRQIDFSLALAGHAGDLGAPAYRAAFRWTRGGLPQWTFIDPAGTSWQLLPTLCAVDTATNATGAQTVRAAFVVGTIARATSAGEWSAAARILSATPPDTTTATRSALNAAARLQMTLLDGAGSFTPGAAGTPGLPLNAPTDGRLDLQIKANAAFDLHAAASDMAGLTIPAETLFVRAPNAALKWAFDRDATVGGPLDTALVAIATALPPQTEEEPLARSLYLWINHPQTIGPQDYRGTLRVHIVAPSYGVTTPLAAAPLTASVIQTGSAAKSALAEVVPHSVVSGTSAQTFYSELLPQNVDTGVDRVLIDLPDGYGTPSALSVQVGGTAVSFQDHSQPNLLDVVLASKVNSASLIETRFVVGVPMTLDSTGSSFLTFFDDTGTSLGPQLATEGDANPVIAGNSWRVSVVAGPLASIAIAPDPASCFVDSTIQFTAQGMDALGHPVQAPITWRTLGGIGVVGSTTGEFTGTRNGSGLVIAESGNVADTASVTVRLLHAIQLFSVSGPTTVYQEDGGVPFAVRLQNLGAQPVVLDTVRLTFSRGSASDADLDFTVAPSPGNPDTVDAGEVATVRFQVGVQSDAATGPLAVSARVSGTEVGGGVRLSDASADTTLALTVRAAGITLSATQVPATLRPGQARRAIFALNARSDYPAARILKGLTLLNLTSGPGDVDLLDQELGRVTLYRDDGDGAFDPSRDPVVLTTVALAGDVHFSPLAVKLPGQSDVLFFVAADVPLAVRDGDALDLALVSAANVEIEPAATLRNAWPLSPIGSFPLDGMVAAQIVVSPRPAITLAPGSTNTLLLDVLLPANGYEPDVLQHFGVINAGNAVPADFDRLVAWADEGDDVFDVARDRSLGALVFTGMRWELSGLSEPVPAGGLRLFVAADIASLAGEGHSVKLGLPQGGSAGVGMQSDNDGPLDAPVVNPFAQTISAVDRVALSHAAAGGVVVHPGDRDVLLMDLLVTNDYAATRTLSRVEFANATSGPGTAAERDAELRLLTLRADGDGDGALGDVTVDPVLGTGFFSQGTVTFAGLSYPVPSDSIRHVFLTGDLSTTAAADGDRLGVLVAGPASVSFVEPTALVGSWPLDASARATVDGFMRVQIANFPVPMATVSSTGGRALALDFAVPANGYQSDVLRSVRAVNLGSAVPADITAMELWRDGGDGQFSAGAGDDVFLGPLSPVAGEWRSPLLNESLAGVGARFYVSMVPASSAVESSTVQLSIPPLGVDNLSGNDGPLDQPLASPSWLTISSAPLLCAWQLPAASTVGQSFTVRLIVRNVGSELIQGIAPSALAPTDSSVLSMVGGPVPATVDLAPAASDTFSWQFSAAAPGEVRLSASAGGTGSPSGLPRRSITTTSGAHRVFLQASSLGLTPVQSMPVSVNRGQTDVVPFSLTLASSAGSGVSDVRVRGLKVRLEDEAGQDIVPDQLVTRVVVNEGTNVYLTRTTLESSGSEMDLQLATPVLVTSTQPTTLSLRLDVSPSASVAGFRAVIVDASRWTAEDATSGAPVSIVTASGSYPVRSPVARIVAEATEVDIAAVAGTPASVDRGAGGVPLMQLRLTNPGLPGISSDVRVAALGLAFRDSTGAPLARPADVFTTLRVFAGSLPLATRTLQPTDADSITLGLSTPANVVAGSPLDLRIDADVGANAVPGRVRVELSSPARVDARDANTRDTVAVIYASNPVAGDWVTVEAPAESVLVRGTPRMPAAIQVGQTDLPVFRATLRHPGAAGVARVRVDSLTVRCRDEQGRTLAPGVYLDAIRVVWGGVQIANMGSLPLAAGSVTVPLPGPMLAPGDTVALDLHLDVSTAAPVGYLEVLLDGPGLHAADANSSAPVGRFPEPGSDLPVVSGIGRIVSPARDLIVGLQNRMPVVLAGDGQPVAVAILALSNPAPAGTGTIELDHLTLQAADRVFAPLPVGSAIVELDAYVNDTLWARSAPLTPDSLTATLVSVARLTVDPQQTRQLELRMTPRSGTSVGSLRVGCDVGGIGVVQPGSALLAVRVSATSGQTFPLWSGAGGFSTLSLAGSYSNFPNPFAAGRDITTFAYYLPRDGRVSLRILTPRGGSVATLLADAARPAGMQQSDRWDGRNGRGEVVYNGVYLAELSVHYADGTSERTLRKVAVVR